jgi:hypothetical protein
VLYPSCSSGCCYCGERSDGSWCCCTPSWVLLLLTQRWRRQCKYWWHWHTDGWEMPCCTPPASRAVAAVVDAAVAVVVLLHSLSAAAVAYAAVAATVQVLVALAHLTVG